MSSRYAFVDAALFGMCKDKSPGTRDLARGCPSTMSRRLNRHEEFEAREMTGPREGGQTNARRLRSAQSAIQCTEATGCAEKGKET